MGLGEYRRKRDFGKTPEPRGKRTAGNQRLTFLVQKHDATHLHYDFRLEHDGVLKSWAVPKGPDLDPAVKRLAMQVEDHPLEYGDFEGTIPEGQYGGGTVMLWDRGTWQPVGDAMQGLRQGRLKFVLNGDKLRGGWMLVRRGGRQANSDERHWFLFKGHDEFAKSGKPITDSKPLSVATGRDLDEIAAQSDRVWGPAGEVSKNGHKKAKPAGAKSARKSAHKSQALNGAAHAGNGKARRPKKAARARAKTQSQGDRSRLAELISHLAAKTGKMPAAQEVELATLAKKAPQGDQWLHEIKFDGYRMLCRIDKGKARFISRNGHDWTKKFPELAQAAGKLPVQQAILDGEVVAIESDGITRFQALQKVFQAGRTEDLVYYAFDVLYLDGRNLTQVPLEQRKEILQTLITEGEQRSIRYSDHLDGTGPEVFAQACRMHLEGIVSKRRDSLYQPGRGVDWLKIKCSRREEFVVGGYTPPSGSRHHFGALLVGYYGADKKLTYAGRVGTGFDDQTLTALHRKFAKLAQDRSPFKNLSGTTGQARGVKWLKPRLVAEVEFSNWTDDRLLRHPSFQGLREDKPATEVVREEPISSSEVKALAKQNPAKSPKNGRQKPRTVRKSTQRSSTELADANIAGVHLSHPDKLLYPEAGISKRDLADYYVAVAEWMLPHVANRPLAVVRCPEGRAGACFFQKHPGTGSSEQLRQVDVSSGAKPEYHLAVDDVGGLVALVQMGVLEIHAWGSQTQRLDRPDRLIFDLDPDPEVPWPQVVQAAREVRLVLEELGLDYISQDHGRQGIASCCADPATDRLGRGQGLLQIAGRLCRAGCSRALHCNDEQGRPKGKGLYRLSAKRPRRDRRGRLFHPCQTGCDRERADCLGGVDFSLTVGPFYGFQRA